MSGQKILDGLKDAVAGNFARVTIGGQVWVRLDNNPLYATAPDMLAALIALADAHESTISGEGYDPEHCECPVLDAARAAIAKAEAQTSGGGGG